MTGSLTGQLVAVTRAPEQAEGLVERLRHAGAAVLVAPTLRIVDVLDPAPVDEALGHLDRYGYLVLTSANGVEKMQGRMMRRGVGAQRFSHLRIAAVGSATAGRLRDMGLRVDVIPEDAVGEALAQRLLDDGAGGKNILLLRAEQGRAELVRILTQAGCQVTDLAVYRTESPDSLPPAFVECLIAGRLNWITVTSPSCWQNLLGLLGPGRVEYLQSVCLASIGPVTSQAIRASHFEPAVEANPHEVGALVAAMCRSVKP